MIKGQFGILINIKYYLKRKNSRVGGAYAMVIRQPNSGLQGDTKIV
jgi:hypothetical protein